jgi:NAD(P)H-dependent FMN reductase
MGSIRAGRHCPQIAAWVLQIAKACSNLRCQFLDLADWPLPMDDEPGIPALGQYSQPHTLAWSRHIAAASAFIIVTPQYNWGYPAPLKNALDHLYKEWEGKPVAIVTYGGHGGGKCATQLRQVLEGMHMRPTATMPELTLTREMIQGGPIDPENDFASKAESIRQAIQELSLALQNPPT